jgi:N-methylhydantoinase B
MILGNSGGAAHAHGDGWLTNGETSDGGSMMRDSTEVLELLRPIRVWTDRIVPDTGGDGRFRGAPSLYVEYGPVDTELGVHYAADGTVNPALGARGGASGALLRPFMRKGDGEVVELEPWGQVILQPGETIISISSAGGGYGPATERDPQHVRHDVAEGWITERRAREVYGVVLATDGSVDEQATSARRGEMGGAGAGAGAAVTAASGAGEDSVLRLIEPGVRLWPTD